MNKKCRPLEKEEYEKIIETITFGFEDEKGKCYPSKHISTILVTMANSGLRINDALSLKLSSIVKDGNRYHFDNFKEQKTKKTRSFTIAPEVYTYLQEYALSEGIGRDKKLFNISSRGVSKHLKRVCEYLGYERVGTHSFRKFFATSIYNNNGYNVELVRELLQHSSVAITQAYLGVSPQIVEKALLNHIYIPNLNQPEMAKAT